MSLMLPRLIDILTGRVKQPNDFYIIPGTSTTVLQEFCELARIAEKLDFGTLQLEQGKVFIEATQSYNWEGPKLTEVEEDAWTQGLIPLPAPVCWYEFTLGNSVTGLLVRGEAGAIDVQRVDYDYKLGRGLFNGMWARLGNDGIDPGELRMNVVDNAGNKKETYAVLGTKKQIEFVRLIHERQPAVLNFASDHHLAIWLTLMVNSRTTRKSRKKESQLSNKLRVKSHKEPLPDHYVIDLYPSEYVRKGEGQGGTHTPPRLHWRRSHLRHFDHQTPGSKWSANEVHDGSTGWWVTLIPRYLVGLQELGEVSHEYRIKPKEDE